MAQVQKWGFIGTSLISEKMANDLINVENTELAAVVSRSKDNLQNFSKKYSINAENQYQQVEQLLEDPTISVIYIATPNDVHPRDIIKCATAGKNILCEKSLSVDMESTYACLASVKENNVFFMEALMYLHHPYIHNILDTLKSGVIGDIENISATYAAEIIQYTNPTGKGVIYDLGCYPVSLVYIIIMELHQNIGSIEDLFEVTTRSCNQDSHNNFIETDCTYSFKDLFTADISVSETHKSDTVFDIVGTKGRIHCVSNPWMPDIDSTFTIESNGSTRSVTVESEGSAYYYQLKNTRDYVNNGDKEANRPAPSVSDSIDIMMLLTQWEESCKNFE
eukprot:TRINITY_DN11631_c0_g1_i1.p1 TRINITY_DN11631_c0_g1~~TRINITY_DN11631_c0_g1_i1.p1  ORF type:complete len:336 (-),score=64.77 TRINITY_DN11631_c0_g1_i1:48-1055(-)